MVDRNNLNLFSPSVSIWYCLVKKMILMLEGIIKNTYERGDYESVDGKSLSKDMSPKNDEKKISG